MKKRTTLSNVYITCRKSDYEDFKNNHQKDYESTIGIHLYTEPVTVEYHKGSINRQLEDLVLIKYENVIWQKSNRSVQIIESFITGLEYYEILILGEDYSVSYRTSLEEDSDESKLKCALIFTPIFADPL